MIPTNIQAHTRVRLGFTWALVEVGNDIWPEITDDGMGTRHEGFMGTNKPLHALGLDARNWQRYGTKGR